MVSETGKIKSYVIVEGWRRKW